MDPITLTLIFLIIAAVFVIDFYKRQNSRVTDNLHADNLKQLLTMRALEHKFSDEKSDETDPQLTVNQITELISYYETGKIPAETFKSQMDSLLN